MAIRVFLLVCALAALAGCGVGEGQGGDPSAGTNSPLRPTQLRIQNDAVADQRITYISITRLVGGVLQQPPEFIYNGREVLPGDQVTGIGLGLARYRFRIAFNTVPYDTVFDYDFIVRDSWVLDVWPGGWAILQP